MLRSTLGTQPTARNATKRRVRGRDSFHDQRSARRPPGKPVAEPPLRATPLRATPLRARNRLARVGGFAGGRRLTVPQVARELGVSNQTVRNWIRRRKLTAIRGVERGVYRIPAPELEAFKRRSANRVEPPYLPVETRDLTSPEAFYEARIAPALAQAGEPSADRLLVRVAAEDALRRRFPTFARDYAHYVGQIADQLEAVSGL